MTASVVWEFRPSPDLFASIWGDADRLSNGNTLMSFGGVQSSASTLLIEADAAGAEVWRLETELRWGAYRAERIASPLKGYFVE